MLTRNYWMAKAAQMVNKGPEVCGSNSNTINGKPKLITVSGNIADNTYSSSYNYSAVYVPLDGNLRYYMANVKSNTEVSENLTNSSDKSIYGTTAVFFGSGNAPVTVDDYKFSGSTIQNITYSYKDNSTYADDGSVCNVTYDYTITNHNDSEITIGEIGIFSEVTWPTHYNGGIKYTHFNYMFERTALETPITIPAGGVGQITYTIKMEYPAPPIEE